MIVSENRFKKIFKKIVVLMLCFTFVLSCFAIPRFECATLEDNIYFEFRDDPFSPSIESVNGSNSIMFYTGANFDIACGSIIIDLNAGTISYGVLGGTSNILAFNQGSWVDNAYAKIIQTKTFTSGETSQTISDELYTWLYEAADVLTLYEFVENNTFNFLISPLNAHTDVDVVGSMSILDTTFSNTILYNDEYFSEIRFTFNYQTLIDIEFINTNSDGEEFYRVDAYRNYNWVGPRDFKFMNVDNIDIGYDYIDVSEEDFYLWYIQQLQRKADTIYNSIGGYYNIINGSYFDFNNNTFFDVSGTYNSLPFNQIRFVNNKLYVYMVSTSGDVLSSNEVLDNSNDILYFNYQNVPFELYYSLINNGVFTSSFPNDNQSNTFSQFIHLIYTFIDIPLYYLRNILDISILSVSLQSICYTLLSVGILIWLIKQVVGLNSIGGK